MKKCVTFLTYRWFFTSFPDTAADLSYCSAQEEHRGRAEFNLSLGFRWEWGIIAQQPDNTFLIGFLNKLFHHLIYYLWCSCASSHALLIAEMLPSVAQNFLSALPILQHEVVGEKHWTSKGSTSSHGKKEEKYILWRTYCPTPFSSFPSIILLSPSSCVVKFDVKSSPGLSLMLLSLTMWLREEAAISSSSTVWKPPRDASKWNSDTSLPAWSPAGSEMQLGCS